MSPEELYAHPGWEWCTFEGARRQVLLIGLETTFREKLQWLEEAETLTLRKNREEREKGGEGTHRTPWAESPRLNPQSFKFPPSPIVHPNR